MPPTGQNVLDPPVESTQEHEITNPGSSDNEVIDLRDMPDDPEDDLADLPDVTSEVVPLIRQRAQIVGATAAKLWAPPQSNRKD